MSDAPKPSALPDIHRLLPQSPDAEMGVLSSIMMAPSQSLSLCHSANIGADHFHIPAHGEVFRTLSALSDSGKPLDFITITQDLRDRNKLDSVGGAAFVSSLSTFLATAASIQHYIDIVVQKHLAREVIRIGTLYAARAYDGQDDALALAGDAHGELTAMLHRPSKRKRVNAILAEIVEEVNSGKDDAGLMLTGIKELDDRMKLFRGDFLVITAPTSCGKSALAFQIWASLAMNGRRVAAYPLEMSAKQTLKRSIAQLGGNHVDFVRRVARDATNPPSKFAMDTLGNFAATAKTISTLKLHIRDDVYRLEAILADIRMEHAVAPLDFVLIDYLQLIQFADKAERRQLQIAAITQRMKALANELQCIVCIPSQVNKEGGTREAQDVENDASALLRIHGEEDEKGDLRPGRISVWKNREGQRHVDIPLNFNPQLVRFDPSK